MVYNLIMIKFKKLKIKSVHFPCEFPIVNKCITYHEKAKKTIYKKRKIKIPEKRKDFLLDSRYLSSTNKTSYWLRRVCRTEWVTSLTRKRIMHETRYWQDWRKEETRIGNNRTNVLLTFSGNLFCCFPFDFLCNSNHGEHLLSLEIWREEDAWKKESKNHDSLATILTISITWIEGQETSSSDVSQSLLFYLNNWLIATNSE